VNIRILSIFMAMVTVASPLTAQPPEGCWGIVMSDWEWTSYRGDPGEPAYSPSESAFRFVPEVFQLTDSTTVPGSTYQPPWSDVVAVVPAPAPRQGYWQNRSQDRGGMRITWSEVGLFFEATFPTFDPSKDSIPGRGYENPNPRQTHHTTPAWIGAATLVKRECAKAGAL